MSRHSHPNSNGQRLRSLVFVQPKFQIMFLAFVGMCTEGALAAWGVTVYLSWRNLEKAAQGLPPLHPVVQALDLQRENLISTFVIVALFSALVVISFGLAFSHRAAGPMVKLKRHLSQVVQGETLEDVQFRQDDFFKEVAEVFNLHMAQVRERQELLRIEEQDASVADPKKRAA